MSLKLFCILLQQLMEGGLNKTGVKYANFDDQLLQEPPYLEGDANERKMDQSDVQTAFNLSSQKKQLIYYYYKMRKYYKVKVQHLKNDNFNIIMKY